MLKLINILACLLIFFISFTDAFRFSPWLRLWVVFVVLLFPISFLYLLYKQKFSIKCYQKEDVLIILMFFGLFISSLFNPLIKNFNYLLAYFFIFGVCYLYLKGIFYNYVDHDRLLKYNTFGVLFVAIFSVLDFFLFYAVNIDIQTIIPRYRETAASYLGVFRRSYGFSTEPTILGFYFNTLGIIGVWFLWYKFVARMLHKIILTLLFVLGWLFTFSGAAIPALLFSMTVSCLLIFVKRPAINKKSIPFLILLLFIFGFAVVKKNNVYNFFSPIIHKMTLQQAAEGSRPVRWLHDIKLINESPIFGHGPGYASVSERGSSVNWYLFLTMEGGLVTSLPIIFFLIFSFFRIYSSNIPGKIWFMSAFLAGSIHLAAISTFFHPFLWMLLIIFTLHQKQAYYNRYVSI